MRYSQAKLPELFAKIIHNGNLIFIKIYLQKLSNGDQK